VDEGTTVQLDNIALQALQDFHYDTLEMGLSYQAAGDYRISIRLNGRNPKLYEGYPIAFNLNLEGVLPELLRKSLLGGGFDEQVLKRVQTEQRR
jgi:hypothetical protein